MDSVEKAQSFAALEAIKAGKWDDVLPLFHMAIQERNRVNKPKVLDRATIRAGTIADYLNLPPQEPHTFQPTSATPLMGQKCGKCSQPSAAPIHTVT